VQIFDTWAGVLPFAEFERWCTAPVAAIISGLRLRHKDARVIGFPKGAGQHLKDYVASTRVDALSLDSTMIRNGLRKTFDRGLVLQRQSRSPGTCRRRRRAGNGDARNSFGFSRKATYF